MIIMPSVLQPVSTKHYLARCIEMRYGNNQEVNNKQNINKVIDNFINRRPKDTQNEENVQKKGSQ